MNAEAQQDKEIQNTPDDEATAAAKALEAEEAKKKKHRKEKIGFRDRKASIPLRVYNVLF